MREAISLELSRTLPCAHDLGAGRLELALAIARDSSYRRERIASFAIVVAIALLCVVTEPLMIASLFVLAAPLVIRWVERPLTKLQEI